MRCEFKNVRITSIVTFDLFREEFDIDKVMVNVEEDSKITFFSQNIKSIGFQKLNNFFDPQYAKKTKIIKFCVELNDITNIKFIKDKFEWANFLEKINLVFRLDKAGICTVRADFYFKFDNSIKTLKLIKIVKATNTFMDSVLFKEYLLDKVLSIFRKKNELLNIVDNYLTYPVITSIDNNLIHLGNKEICGICWKNENYATFNQRKIDTILNNDISPYIWGKFVITIVATCIFYPKETESYINDRLKVIEMFLRQNFVLKRIDNNLDKLFNNFKTNKDNLSLKKSINEIENNHFQINSNLEFYRNTNVALADMYVIIIDTFTKVFNQDKHYIFVKEKIKTCDTVYHGLLNDRKNEIMESIQWIIILLGVLTLVASILFNKIIALENNVLAGLGLLFSLTFVVIISTFLLIKGYYQIKRKIEDKK